MQLFDVGSDAKPVTDDSNRRFSSHGLLVHIRVILRRFRGEDEGNRKIPACEKSLFRRAALASPSALQFPLPTIKKSSYVSRTPFSSTFCHLDCLFVAIDSLFPKDVYFLSVLLNGRPRRNTTDLSTSLSFRTDLINPALRSLYGSRN